MTPASPSSPPVSSPQLPGRDGCARAAAKALPLDDPARVNALRRLDLFNTDERDTYHRFARLACQFLHSPISFVALVGRQSHFLKAIEGLPADGEVDRRHPIALALNQQVVASGHALVLPTLSPAPSTAPAVGAYLGFPIRTPDGFVVGAFGTLTHEPRDWQQHEIELMHDLNALVQSEVARVHHRRLSDAALQATEDRLEKLLAWADCLVWEAEVSYTGADWDWKFNIQPSGLNQRLFGNRVIENRDGLWYKLALPDQPEMDRRCRHALHNELPGYDQEFRVVADDGTELWIRETVTITRIGPQRFWLVGAATDVTLQKRYQRDMQRDRDEALEASRVKSQFLANMSHEIRTPMNGIVGMANLLMDTSLDANQRRMGKVICESGDALLAIINDVLDLSKIEAGMMRIENEPTDLRKIVDDVVALMQPQAKHRGIEMHAPTMDPRIPDRVVADSLRLRQIVTNLVGNAVKFTEQGHVQVTVEVIAENSTCCQIKATVTDTGIGISPAEQSQLFAPFVQVDGSHSRRHGGTGLGLAISRQLVEMMGGSIDFHSAPGEGSSFWFVLKLAKAAALPDIAGLAPRPASPPTTGNRLDPRAAPTAPASSSAPPAACGRKVLLVEDNPTNQMVASLLLEKMGLRYVVAGNGAEALQKGPEGPYAAVLMDCQMPVMDGYTTTQRIREGGVPGIPADIPVIALTAYAMKGDKERCLAVGMNDHVTKPIRSDILRDVLQRWRVIAPTPLVPTADGQENGHEPLLDAELMAEYRELPGQTHATLLEDLVHNYFVTIEERLGELQELLSQHQAEAAARCAHAIAGSSANLGSRTVRSALIAVEKAALAADWSLAADRLVQSMDLIAQLEVEARQLFPGLKAA